jgi:hypothetical protein
LASTEVGSPTSREPFSRRGHTDRSERGAPRGEETGVCQRSRGYGDVSKLFPRRPWLAYKELGDAIAYVNAHARPLALYISIKE